MIKRNYVAQRWLLGFLSLDERLGKPQSPLPSLEALRPDQQELLFDLIHKEKLAHFVASSKNFPELPSQLRGAISQIAFCQAQAALVVARELIKVDKILSQAGIDHLFYKGLPLAELTQGNPIARGGGDIDLLVPREQVVRTHQILSSSGGLAGFRIVPHKRFSFGLFLRLYKEVPYHFGLTDVDLHWRLINPTGISPDARLLLQRSQKLTICGYQITTLGNFDSLVASACQFYFDGCRSLRQLVDFQLLANKQVERVGGYHRKVVRLVSAVERHAQLVFAKHPSQVFESRPNNQLQKRIESDWRTRFFRNEERHRIAFKATILTHSLARQISLGKFGSNLLRFVGATVLDFHGTNFFTDRWVIAKSLLRKVKSIFVRVSRGVF